MTGRPLQSGDVVRVDGRASVQFAGDRGFCFRVIRVHDWPTYHGWVWLDGYELDSSGDAVERRSIFVQPSRLLPVPQRRRGLTAAQRLAGFGGGQPAEPGRASPGTVRPAGAGTTTRKQDQASIHRAWTYPQRGSLV